MNGNHLCAAVAPDNPEAGLLTWAIRFPADFIIVLNYRLLRLADGLSDHLGSAEVTADVCAVWSIVQLAGGQIGCLGCPLDDWLLITAGQGAVHRIAAGVIFLIPDTAWWRRS